MTDRAAVNPSEGPDLVKYRVTCTCQMSPFYEGDSEVAARRYFASIARAAADSNERPGEPHHEARLERAAIRWEAVDG